MRLPLGIALGLSFAFIGCGRDDTATSAPSDAAGSTDGDSGLSDAVGGAESNDAAASGESGDRDRADSAPPKSGFIGVVSYPTEMATVFRNSVGASFFDGPGNSFQEGCQREVIGTCWVALCDLTDGGDQQPPTGAVQSAGTITLVGTSPAFSLEFDTSKMLYDAVPAVPTDRLLFIGGNTITFTAAGADVSAFSDSLVAPAPIAITSPVLVNTALSIDTSQDLVFKWSDVSVGNLAFNVRTVTTSGVATVSSSFVSCQFDASALIATIPSAMLQKLHKTDSNTTAALTTDNSNTKEVAAGDHSVHLAVGSILTTADGKTPYTSSQVTIF